MGTVGCCSRAPVLVLQLVSLLLVQLLKDAQDLVGKEQRDDVCSSGSSVASSSEGGSS